MKEEDGGQGGSLMDAVIAIETIAQVCPRSADVIQAGPNPEVVREMMKAQHQGMIKSLTTGQFGGGATPSAAAPEAPPVPPVPPRPTMPRGRRTLDEVIDEQLASRRGKPS